MRQLLIIAYLVTFADLTDSGPERQMICLRVYVPGLYSVRLRAFAVVPHSAGPFSASGSLKHVMERGRLSGKNSQVIELNYVPLEFQGTAALARQ